MQPIALTDDQLNAVLAAAHPLEHHAREAFLREIAQLIQEQPTLGDGLLHRLIPSP